jgi:hypothetical protein
MDIVNLSSMQYYAVNIILLDEITFQLFPSVD